MSGLARHSEYQVESNCFEIKIKLTELCPVSKYVYHRGLRHFLNICLKGVRKTAKMFSQIIPSWLGFELNNTRLLVTYSVSFS
jgi:hypothetical protein